MPGRKSARSPWNLLWEARASWWVQRHKAPPGRRHNSSHCFSAYHECFHTPHHQSKSRCKLDDHPLLLPFLCFQSCLITWSCVSHYGVYEALVRCMTSERDSRIQTQITDSHTGWGGQQNEQRNRMHLTCYLLVKVFHGSTATRDGMLLFLSRTSLGIKKKTIWPVLLSFSWIHCSTRQHSACVML